MRRGAAVLAAVLAVGLLPVGAGAGDRATPSCRGVSATIVGTAGADTLVGTSGDDVIVGRGGDDVIRGKGGDDVICGASGDDLLYGGSGRDTLIGGTGDDEMWGGPGGDLLKGGGGADGIDGGAGNDVLSGWFGADRMFGRYGRDRIHGNLGDDVIDAGEGDDQAHGGAGTDSIDGGPGMDQCVGEITINCELGALKPGDEGPDVEILQQMLADKHLYRGPRNGVYGAKLEEAVIAFHKVIDRPRDPAWEADDWQRLAAFTPKPPKNRSGEPDRLEVDIGHQVMYFIEDDDVAAIFPVSTGGGYVYWSERQQDWVVAHTPRGDFTLLRYTSGWSCDPLYGWCIYKPWSFTSAYALHGYGSVPPYPASHGCVRVHLWEADWLSDHLEVGMPIHTWDR
jgi:hypothetical protein